MAYSEDTKNTGDRKKISELCRIHLGGTPKTGKKEFWGGDIKWATAKDVANLQGRYLTETERRITEKGVNGSNAKVFPEGTIVITARGTVGKLAILGEPMSFNQTCYGLIPIPAIDKMYVFYALKNGISKIDELSYGTVFQTITMKTFDELEIRAPSLEQQRRVSKILADLDSKIELNQQMNKTLESIAQAIFKHWFINFEFPDENGQPYKSSGGEMVDSELGEIPKGWEVLTLGNLLSSIESGKRPKGGIDPDLKFGIPSIGAENISGLGYYDYSKTKFVSFEYFEGMKQGIVKDKDVLLYKDGAQIGRKTMFGCGFPFDKCCVNEHVFILRTNEKINQFFLFLWLNQDEVTRNIQNLNSNSAQPGLNRDSIKTLQVFVPHKDVLNNFEGVVSKLIGKIFLNSLNSRELSLIRDLLLPKLMTGRIRVPLEE